MGSFVNEPGIPGGIVKRLSLEYNRIRYALESIASRASFALAERKMVICTLISRLQEGLLT
jgi:hypothetical protein